MELCFRPRYSVFSVSFNLEKICFWIFGLLNEGHCPTFVSSRGLHCPVGLLVPLFLALSPEVRRKEVKCHINHVCWGAVPFLVLGIKSIAMCMLGRHSVRATAVGWEEVAPLQADFSFSTLTAGARVPVLSLLVQMTDICEDRGDRHKGTHCEGVSFTI